MNTNSMKYVSDKLKGEQRQKEEKSKNEREQVKKNHNIFYRKMLKIQ